jgi:SAM-dependent methyltransferase
MAYLGICFNYAERLSRAERNELQREAAHDASVHEGRCKVDIDSLHRRARMTAHDTRLARTPDHYDEFGRAWYPRSDPQGQRHQTNELIRGAMVYVRHVGVRVRRRLADEVIRYAGDRRVAVLDVGGGMGRFFDAIEPVVETYFNVDPASDPPSAEEQRRLRDPRYRRLLASGTNLPLADRSVDVTLFVGSLDHIPDHRRALKEAARVTRPGGLVLVHLNNRRSWWKAVLTGTGVLRRRQSAISREHYIQLSLSELIDELSGFFRPTRSYTVTFAPHVPIAWRVLLPIFEAVGPRLLPAGGANSIVICECD